MGISDTLQPHSPLGHVRLDAKTFVQLTVWFIVILGAFALGKYLLAWLKGKAQQVTGAVTQHGSSNPFFG